MAIWDDMALIWIPCNFQIDIDKDSAVSYVR